MKGIPSRITATCSFLKFWILKNPHFFYCVFQARQKRRLTELEAKLEVKERELDAKTEDEKAKDRLIKVTFLKKTKKIKEIKGKQ